MNERISGGLSRLRERARALRTEVGVLYRVGRDPRVPWLPKLVALAVVAYALSPIDLIPDFIPVLGYLDDLVLVPAGLALAIRLVPPDLLAEHRRAAGAEPVGGRALTLSGALMVVSTWLLAVGLLAAGWWVARG